MLGDWPKARIHPRVLQCRWDDFTARIYAGMAGSVLVIVRQVNASPDMRRAARISMYCGITHLRQIISSLNYIFPRRTPVTARGFISHLHRPSMKTKTEFLGHFPRRRCIAYAPRLLDRAFRFMQIGRCRPSQIFTRVRRKKRLSRVCVCVFNSQSILLRR